MKIALLLTIALFVALVTARPFRLFEPDTPERKAVLLELFDALFVPTRSPTTDHSPHSIRAQIETHFGYVSRTGVDYILATLGHIPDADAEELEELVESGASHTPAAYKHYCKIPVGLWRRLAAAHSLAEWLIAIEAKTGRDLTTTRAFLAEQ